MMENNCKINKHTSQMILEQFGIKKRWELRTVCRAFYYGAVLVTDAQYLIKLPPSRIAFQYKREAKLKLVPLHPKCPKCSKNKCSVVNYVTCHHCGKYICLTKDCSYENISKCWKFKSKHNSIWLWWCGCHVCSFLEKQTCPTCLLIFDSVQDMKTHRQNVHGDYCAICDEVFYTRPKLLMHIAQNHNNEWSSMARFGHQFVVNETISSGEIVHASRD